MLFNTQFFEVCFFVSVLAGGIASVSGFGIGSLLTPMMATQVDMQVAVAAVSIPHFLATALRCWVLRKHIDRAVLLKFGAFSAIGGLAGACCQHLSNNPLLFYLMALLLVYAGVSGLSGWSQRFKIPQKWSWLAGLASGLLGGLVGNQGGIRSAALFGFQMDKSQLVATATAIGVVVDLARMPVYVFTVGRLNLEKMAHPILFATLGCLVGTLLGKFILGKVPEQTFRSVVSALILLLGVYMALKAASGS